MWLYIPFIYFTILFVRIVYKCGLNVGAYMVAIYAVSSLFSIILFHENYNYSLVDFGSIQITAIPTILYCSLITFCLWPFLKYRSNDLGRGNLVSFRSSQILRVVEWLYVIIFFVVLLVFREQIIFSLAEADLGDIRMDGGGYEQVVRSLSGFGRILMTPLMILGSTAYFMLPVFFYRFCVYQRHFLWNLLILLSSLTPVILGTLYADRSNVFYWVLLFGLCYIWFKKLLISSTHKRFFWIIGGVVLVALGWYFSSVTIARFEGRDVGAEGYLIIYAGQPFLNFCNLWTNYHNPEMFWGRVFPWYNFFFDGNMSVRAWCDKALVISKMNINIFFSVLGLFLVDLGRLGVVGGSLIINWLGRKVVRLERMDGQLRMSNVLLCFAVLIILQCGVISFFYANIDRCLGVCFWLIVVWLLRKERV